MKFNIDVKGKKRTIEIKEERENVKIKIRKKKFSFKKNDKKITIQIDIEGYLKNRKASLELLATNFSEKVKRTGKPATIGPMNAHDRRIVHLTLKEDNGVRTQSVGDSYLRKLVIIPRKKSSPKRQEQ